MKSSDLPKAILAPVEAIRDPDRLPDSTDPSGPCPQCGRVSNFTLIAQLPVTYDKSGVHYAGAAPGQERPVVTSVAILQCHGCLDNTVVIQDNLVGGVRGGKSGKQTWEGIHWWPTPDVADLGRDVPTSIAAPYAEGLRCLSANAPNGAVTMFRTAMIYLVEDKGSAAAKTKNDLKNRIKQMVTDGTLHPDLGQWVTHVRLSGNAAAHPDLFGDVSMDEARDVARLVHTLLDVLYVVPSTIARRQSARARP